MRTTSYHRLHWQQRMLLIGLMLICIFAASSSSFQPASSSPLLHLTRSCNKKSSSSALAYAGTSSAAGPMSQVDPNARSGGCPFLVKSHDAHVTYAVPALFDNTGINTSSNPNALDKKSLQLALLSLIQEDRFLDLLHAQYLKVVRAHQQQQKSKSNEEEK
jgi:hypothetical protein